MGDFRKILEEILESSGGNGIIFLSEADFQFYLAWQIKEKLKDKGEGKVILEYPDDIVEKDENGKEKAERIYYDIWVEDGSGKTHLIELKYRTKEQKDVMRYGRKFDLKNQSAQDLGRYHFIKDIERLESQKKIANGKSYCIMLTNDKSYWLEPPPDCKTPQDIAFRIHKNIMPGCHEWGGRDKKYRGRVNEKINIKKGYKCKWQPYECGSVKNEPNGEFRYLLLEIPPENKA